MWEKGKPHMYGNHGAPSMTARIPHLLAARRRWREYVNKAFYVITIDPEINVARVSDRVEDGGHDVPTDKIKSRYFKSRNLIPELVNICDVVHIYDNTGNVPERIFKKKHQEIRFFETECWDVNAIEELTGVKRSGGQSVTQG